MSSFIDVGNAVICFWSAVMSFGSMVIFKENMIIWLGVRLYDSYAAQKTSGVHSCEGNELPGLRVQTWKVTQIYY